VAVVAVEQVLLEETQVELVVQAEMVLPHQSQDLA
jgi:hypothetical protein